MKRLNEDEDEDDYEDYEHDIPEELATKYENQKIESKKIARAFLDDDGHPLWNKLFTWEVIALRAGYLIPEKYGNMGTCSGLIHWYLGRKVIPALNRCKKQFSEIKIPIVGDKYTHFIPAFDSFRNVHNKRLYGFTTDKSLHYLKEKEYLGHLIHGQVRFDKQMHLCSLEDFSKDFQEKIRFNNENAKGAILLSYSRLQDIALTMQ